MPDDKSRVPFLPDTIKCSIKFTLDSGQSDSDSIDDGPSKDTSINEFRSIAQSFVTYLQVLWEYAHEIGAAAERTSLSNLALLPSLLREVEDRRNNANDDESPVATIVFSVEDRKKEQQQEKSYPIYEIEHARKLQDCLIQHNRALDMLNETVLQQMVNAWEHAIGDLLAWKLRADPDIIPKDRMLSYSQLLSFCDLAEAQRHLIEKEVSEFLKSRSTIEQIRYFKKEFRAQLENHFPKIGDLCEIVLRRHAIVHAGGKASSEYCRRVKKLKGVSSSPVEEGSPLLVNAPYIKEAWAIIYASGVVLIHLVARVHAKQSKCKEDEDAADSFLINATFNNIKNRQYEAAELVLEYAKKLRLNNSTSDLMVLINLAQTHKWKGDAEKCLHLLDEYDWSSCSANFRLCAAALREDIAIFKRELCFVAREGSIRITDLYEWPVFNAIRKNEHFMEWIKEAYGDDVSAPKTTLQPKLIDFHADKPLSKLLKEIVNDMIEGATPVILDQKDL